MRVCLKKCDFPEMWQDLDGLGGSGVNSGVHQVDQFGTTGEETNEKGKKTNLFLCLSGAAFSHDACVTVFKQNISCIP